LKYGRDDATDEEMYQAAELDNAHKLISDLPNAYGTGMSQKLNSY
jgi:ABC-type multidrug transport system fused ATPase/permease subunit